MYKKTGLVALMLAALSVAPTVGLAGHEPRHTASAACAKAPAFTAAKTRFGVSLSTSGAANVGEDLAGEERRFGRIPVVRTWDPGAPKSEWSQRSRWFGDRWVVTSFRMPPRDVLAGRYDSQLRSYFSSAPTTAPIFWNYIHEPEDEIKRGEFTAAQYRDAFRRIVDIAASYCRSNLYPTLVLMGWTTNSGSKLNWRDYYPGDAYISVLAWDPYNGANGDATSYRTPAQLFDSVVSVSRAAGKPWGIAETGSVRIPGDSSGTGRAAWLKKVGQYFSDKGALFVTYFQSQNKGDFELRDTPSINAWKAWVQS